MGAASIHHCTVNCMAAGVVDACMAGSGRRVLRAQPESALWDFRGNRMAPGGRGQTRAIRCCCVALFVWQVVRKPVGNCKKTRGSCPTVGYVRKATHTHMYRHLIWLWVASRAESRVEIASLSIRLPSPCPEIVSDATATRHHKNAR